MKIGILAYDLSTLAGGTQLSITLGTELKKEGHEVAYACVYEDLNWLSKKFCHEFDFKIYKKKRPIFGRIMVNYNSMLNHSFPIQKMCKDFKPDVVIEVGGFINSLVVPVMLKIPSIHYAHETSFDYSQKNVLNKLYFLPVRFIEKKVARKATICANSNYTRDIVKKAWNIDAQVIYPPVDTDVFRPSENKENIILCVLRFRSVYKFEYLIDAFRRLNRRDYSLVIIGGLTKENEEYYDFLKDFIKKDNNITLLPNADFSQLLDFYKKSRFFWYPTGAYYGIAIAEAQSAGLPTISFGANSGPGEIIINNKTGYLVETYDEMIKNTRKLLDNDELWKDMSIAARKNAVERLGLDIFRNKFREVIEIVRR